MVIAHSKPDRVITYPRFRSSTAESASTGTPLASVAFDGFDVTTTNGEPVYVDLFVDGQHLPNVVFFPVIGGGITSPAQLPFAVTSKESRGERTCAASRRLLSDAASRPRPRSPPRRRGV